MIITFINEIKEADKGPIYYFVQTWNSKFTWREQTCDVIGGRNSSFIYCLERFDNSSISRRSWLKPEALTVTCFDHIIIYNL